MTDQQLQILLELPGATVIEVPAMEMHSETIKFLEDLQEAFKKTKDCKIRFK